MKWNNTVSVSMTAEEADAEEMARIIRESGIEATVTKLFSVNVPTKQKDAADGALFANLCRNQKDRRKR